VSEELVKKRIDELLKEEKINDIVRHEIEERISRRIWQIYRECVEDTISRELKELQPKIHKMLEEEATTQIKELIKKNINKIDEEIQYHITREPYIKDALSSIIREKVINDPEVQKSINEWRQKAGSIVEQQIQNIHQAIVAELERRYLLNMESITTMLRDLVQRVSILEAKTR